MTTTEMKSIRARGLDGEIGLRARPLTYDEIQELILLARRTEWLGNPELTMFVVDHGLSKDPKQVALVARDHFLACNVSREIWILTLQELARQARTLARFSGITFHVPRIRKYRYIHLVTPGFLHLILREMETLDVEEFSRAFLGDFILGIEEGGKFLSADSRKQYIDQNLDSIVPFFLTAIGLDRGLANLLPKEVLPTAATRFFVALKLADTLDWTQYRTLLTIFNKALEELSFRSNQLGGADTTRDRTQLITGMHLLPALLSPARVIPPEVAMTLLHDAVGGHLKRFSPKQRKVIFAVLEEPLRIPQTKPDRSSATSVNEKQIIEAILAGFMQSINKHEDIITKACFVYMDAYTSYMERFLDSKLKRDKEAKRFLSIPDCRVLVEGPSDEIYYRKFLNLLGPRELMISIESCDGKEGVAKRALESRKRSESRIATRPPMCASLLRVLGKDHYAAVLQYRHGVMENQFSPEIHCRIINLLFSEGEVIVPDDLSLSRPMDKVLQKILWGKKRERFDKRAYAEGLSKYIQRVEDIPLRLLTLQEQY